MLDLKKIRLYVTNDLVYDQRMQRICTTLTAAGATVTLVGRKRKMSKSIENWNFGTRRFSCLFNKGPLFYAEMNIRIFFDALFSSADTHVANDLDTLTGVMLARVFRKKKVVFDAHEWFTEVPEVINRLRVQSVWKYIERTFVPKVDAAYTVNRSLQENFTNRLGIDFGVVRNVPFKKPEISVEKNSKKTIIYQGALNAGRGLEVAITAMKELAGYELWIVGEGDLSTELRELAASRGVAERIKFWGYRRPEDLHAITSQAHVGINLLEGKPKNYYYSLANKFFDFMQAGMPSINMKFPEYEYILKDYTCGVMIADCLVEEYVEAVRKLFRSSDDYKGYVAESRRAAEEFHWDKEKERLLAVYSKK